MSHTIHKGGHPIGGLYVVFVMPVAYMPNIESAYGSLACVCAVFELTCTSSKTGMTCMLVFTPVDFI